MSQKTNEQQELENGKVTLTKQEINKSWYSWFKYCLTVFGYERLQAPGFILSMLPIFKKFYGNDPETMVKRLKCHAVFYNTNPVFGAVVNGIVASMEVERGNGTEMTDEFINSIKVGLMGPLAGIGDSQNDIGMMKLVQNSFCMTHGDKKAQRAAARIVDSVSAAIEYLLEEIS